MKPWEVANTRLRLQEAVLLNHKAKTYYFERFSFFDRVRRVTGGYHQPLMMFYQDMFNYHFEAWTRASSELDYFNNQIVTAYVVARKASNGMADGATGIPEDRGAKGL